MKIRPTTLPLVLSLLAGLPTSAQSLSSPSTGSRSDASSSRLIDVTGNGRRDRLVFGSDGSLRVELHVRGRAFETVPQVLPKVTVTDVLVTDLDGDGALDLYLISPEANGVLLGDGTGAFQGTNAFPELADAGDGLSAEREDLDGDGRDDLLLHNRAGDVLFWANETGGFERDAASTPERAGLLPGAAPGPQSAAETDATSPAANGAVSAPTRGGSTTIVSSTLAQTTTVSAPSSAGGTNALRPPTPASGGSAVTPLSRALVDQGATNGELLASSVPALGRLFPLSAELNVAATGNVGIGTTTPDSPLSLSVNGATNEAGLTQNQLGTSSSLELTTADRFGLQATRILMEGGVDRPDLQFLNGHRGAELPSMTIRGEDGWVGVSTSNPQAPLHINSVNDADATSGGVLIVGKTNQRNLALDNNEIVARDNGATSTLKLQRNGGALTVGESTNSPLLGIGASSPKAPLTLQVNGANAQVGITQNQAGGTSSFEIVTEDGSGDMASRILVGGGNGTPNISFLKGGQGSETPTVTINGDTGYLGVGLESPKTPIALKANGASHQAGLTQNEIGGPASLEITTKGSDSNQATRIAVGGNVAEPDINFYSGNSGGEVSRLHIEGQDGRVGIGTETPDAPLHVNAISDATLTDGGILIVGPSTDENLVLDGNELMARDNGVAGELRLQRDGGYLTVGASSADARVGIGLNNPVEALDVDGNVRVRGGQLQQIEHLYGKDASPLEIWSDDTMTVPNIRMSGVNRMGLGEAFIYNDVGVNIRHSDDRILRVETAAASPVLLVDQNPNAVRVRGDFSVSNGSKNFRMDHPLDPAGKYLMHSCVESNEAKNVYDGRATLGSDGSAWVELPDYFEAINIDVRYQLTCIGGYAQVYVGKEVENGRFLIKGGTPGLEVSWQVTGVRNDPWFRDNPYRDVVEKTGEERGRYLYPQGYGKPKSMAIGLRGDAE